MNIEDLKQMPANKKFAIKDGASRYTIIKKTCSFGYGYVIENDTAQTLYLYEKEKDGKIIICASMLFGKYAVIEDHAERLIMEMRIIGEVKNIK